MVVAVDLTTVA